MSTDFQRPLLSLTQSHALNSTRSEKKGENGDALRNLFISTSYFENVPWSSNFPDGPADAAPLTHPPNHLSGTSQWPGR